MQGLLGDWRQQFQGYQPPMQQPVPPNLQATQFGTQGYPMQGYGLSPEFIGLLSQQFPGMKLSGPGSQGQSKIDQLQGLLVKAQNVGGLQLLFPSANFQSKKVVV